MPDSFGTCASCVVLDRNPIRTPHDCRTLKRILYRQRGCGCAFAPARSSVILLSRFGGFAVTKGIAYFKAQGPRSLRLNARASSDVMLHIAPYVRSYGENRDGMQERAHPFPVTSRQVAPNRSECCAALRFADLLQQLGSASSCRIGCVTWGGRHLLRVASSECGRGRAESFCPSKGRWVSFH